MNKNIELIQTFENRLIEDVVKLVECDDLTYLDAVLLWCEERSLEVETVAPIIQENHFLLSKIQEEAEGLNFLKKTMKLILE